MAGTIDPKDPTLATVGRMMPAGTAGSASAKIVSSITVEIPFSTGGSTANAGFIAWINPEGATIHVHKVEAHFYTTGTGTFDMGVGSDGTGSANDIFQAGTMNTSVNLGLLAQRGLTGTEGAGSGGKASVWVLGPGGVGTNNSIVGKTSETATTARGFLYVTYYVASR